MFFWNKNYNDNSISKLDKLGMSIKKAEQTIEGARILMRNMPQFARENSHKLNSLIQNQENTIRKAQSILRNNGR